MIGTRLLLSSLTVLALAACAPSKDKDEGRDSAPPLGYELAMAKEAIPGVAATAAVVDLSVDELRIRLDSGDTRLIDVRTSEEVARGTIPGAEHVALDQFDPASLDLSDGREVVLYCRSGRRSAIAGEKLAAHTGKPAAHLGGGILAWQEAGEAIETP